MAAGMMPKGGGGVLGWDPFGNQAANPRPSRSDFVSHGSMGAASIQDAMRFRTQRDMPVTTQTAQQYKDFNTAESNWARIDAARKKRQEAYAAMAQETGPTPAAFNQNRGGGTRQAGDPLTMGGAPAYEMALYGQPRKWREQVPSIVNLRTA
jgi:hypothetical protein